VKGLLTYASYMARLRLPLNYASVEGFGVSTMKTLNLSLSNVIIDLENEGNRMASTRMLLA